MPHKSDNLHITITAATKFMPVGKQEPTDCHHLLSILHYTTWKYLSDLR